MPQSILPCRVASLDHLVLTVANIDRTLAFYAEVLGMHPEAFQTASGETRWALMFGAQKINLHQHGQEFDPKSAHPTPGSADLCFLTSTPIALWITHLTQLDIPIEEGPVARTGAQGPLTSLYLRDPDRNLIEVSVPG